MLWGEDRYRSSTSGTGLVYSTYLGGNSYDVGMGIAVDGSGNAYVTGRTESSNFPTTRAPTFTNAPSNATVTVNTSTPGLAVITFSTSTGLVLNPGSARDFVHLTASVPSTATYGAKEILDLENITIVNKAGTTISAIDDARPFTRWASLETQRAMASMTGPTPCVMPNERSVSGRASAPGHCLIP